MLNVEQLEDRNTPAEIGIPNITPPLIPPPPIMQWEQPIPPAMTLQQTVNAFITQYNNAVVIGNTINILSTVPLLP